MEFPDDWLNLGDVWLMARTDESVEVKFNGYVDEYTDENGYHAQLKDYNSVMQKLLKKTTRQRLFQRYSTLLMTIWKEKSFVSDSSISL